MQGKNIYKKRRSRRGEIPNGVNHYVYVTFWKYNYNFISRKVKYSLDLFIKKV